MDLDQLRNEVSKRMPAERFDHVLRVAETAKTCSQTV